MVSTVLNRNQPQHRGGGGGGGSGHGHSQNYEAQQQQQQQSRVVRRKRRSQSTNRRRAGSQQSQAHSQAQQNRSAHQQQGGGGQPSQKKKKKKKPRGDEVAVECKPYRRWCPLLLQSTPWWMAAPPESSIRIAEEMRRGDGTGVASLLSSSDESVSSSPTRMRSLSTPPSSGATSWSMPSLPSMSTVSPWLDEAALFAAVRQQHTSISPPARLQSPVAAAVAATAPERLLRETRMRAAAKPNKSGIPTAPWGNPEEDEQDEVRAAFFEGMTMRLNAATASSSSETVSSSSSASSSSYAAASSSSSSEPGEGRPRANSNPPKPKPGGKFKTKLCWHWESFRQCPFGETCSFAHGLHELMKAEPIQQHQ